MRFRRLGLIRPLQGRVAGLALVALVLASSSFWAGCGDEPEQEGQIARSSERVAVPEQEGQAPQSNDRTDQPQPDAQTGQGDYRGEDSSVVAPSSSMMPSLGQVGLNERAFDATVIARATLISTNATAENIGTDSNGATVFRGLLEFKFKVLEYLKGTGGGELVVFVTDQLDRTYATMELALEVAQSWKRDRDTRWDDREALIFAEKPVGSSGQVTRYSFGPYGYIEAYTLDSKNRVWLPSASSSAAGSASSGDLRFLLEEPGDGGSSDGVSGSGQPETVSVSEMKTLIAKLEKWRKDGDGVVGYLECIRASFNEESRINGYKERGESPNSTYDFYLDSSLPAGTVIEEGHPTDGRDGRVWIEGRDIILFSYGDGAFRTMRPLPTGKYFVYPNLQAPRFIPCGYYPAEYKNKGTWFVNVTAPAGTIHEAFFDPVTVGSSIAADASNGVLKPTAFTDGNNASATLQRIAWEAPSTGSGQAGTVKLKLTPHTGLANHVVDFIALDGKVILSLDADDATVDAANNTLSWPVTYQPWKNGDKLMLRIHNGPVTPVPTPTPGPTPAAPTGLTATAGAGSVTLTWDNPSNPTITGYEYNMRWAGVAWQPWNAIPNSGSSTTSHTVTGLTGGTEYRFHVRAVNAFGPGTAAPNADPWYVAATPSVPPPAAPTGLTATAGRESVTLNWNNPSDSTITRYEYNMRWTGVGWQPWKAIPNSGSSTTSHTVTGLTGGTEYRFHVRAVNASGTGPQAPNADPWYVSATPGKR